MIKVPIAIRSNTRTTLLCRTFLSPILYRPLAPDPGTAIQEQKHEGHASTGVILEFLKLKKNNGKTSCTINVGKTNQTNKKYHKHKATGA